MTRFLRPAVFGLLWLALGSLASAATLTIKDQSFNVAGGGQFEAYFGDQQTVHPSIFDVFCIDYRNTVSPSQTYDANVSTPDNLADISATRYGTTLQPSFFYQTVPSGQMLAGQSLGGALDRYLMAAWLTTQFDFSSGAGTGAKDIGIQDAEWNLLDVDGNSPTSSQSNLWLNNALAWEKGLIAAGTLSNFEKEVRIYTSSDVAGVTPPDRYHTGVQEMIGVVPEPSALLLFGTGLIALGLLVRHQRRIKN